MHQRTDFQSQQLIVQREDLDEDEAYVATSTDEEDDELDGILNSMEGNSESGEKEAEDQEGDAEAKSRSSESPGSHSIESSEDSDSEIDLD